MRIPKDLAAAAATPLVLSLLDQHDSYGYEIIQHVRTLSGGELEWKEGMLYPLLHRLAAKGLISAYDGTAESGRTRRYYRITTAGKAELVEQRDAFVTIAALLGLAPNPTPGGSHV